MPSLNRNKRRWRAKVRVRGEIFYLGTFDTREEAEREERRARLAYRGEEGVDGEPGA